MKYLSALVVVCLLILPSVALAQQISPNPNPVGSTITVDKTGAFNSVGFSNLGAIDITNAGTLTNTALLENNNGGTLTNSGYLTNNDTLTN